MRRWIQPVAGVVLFVAGIFFCIFPGPGLPLLLVGAMLLAERSRVMSHALDRLELNARKAIRRTREWWREASVIAKDAVVVVGCMVIAGASYGAWHFLFGR